MEKTNVLKGHKEKVKCVRWLQSKTGSELFSASFDGEVGGWVVDGWWLNGGWLGGG